MKKGYRTAPWVLRSALLALGVGAITLFQTSNAEGGSQPVRGPSEPDDLRNYDASDFVGGLIKALAGGALKHPVRFPLSLRVGSGAATLAAFDGVDGVLTSDGASSIILCRDRADNTKYFGWYESGTIRLISQQGGDLWLISPTTGLITQDALAALSYNTGISQAGGWIPSGTRLMKPDGLVYLSFNLTTANAIIAGTVLATVAAAHKPTGFVGLTGRYSGSNTPVTGYVNTSGQITVDQAMAAGSAWDGTVVYYP